MGMHNSCAIGQCHTWASTLFREPGEAPLGVADSEVRGEYMIRMAWLYGEFVKTAETSATSHRTKVGAIFVLLDGVFILTVDKALRDVWNGRLARNEKKFHVLRKTPGDGDYPEVADPGTAIGFSGIEFCYGQGHRPISRKPVNLHAATVQQCKSVLGVLGYDVRARGVSLLDVPELRHAARRFGAFTSNNEAARFSKEERQVLRGLDTIRQRDDYVPAKPVITADVIVLAVTDAQPRGKGYVVFNNEGLVDHWGPAVVPGDPEPELGSQMQMEAEAVADLCELLRARHGRSKRIALVVGIDADAIRAATNKGDSKSDYVAESLRRMRSSRVSVVACRVPGEQNCADGPSRRQPPQEDRIVPSFAAVSRLAKEVGDRFAFPE
jgi:hypothetical protein